MKAKTFFIAVLAGVLACLGTFILLLSLEDPFFVMRGIGEGETALFDNQRYQMAGLIRHQDYTQVVMGTSLVANYRASWFTEGTGKETLKITFPDGWVTEFDTALKLALRTHPQLDRVYFCLDPNILIRPDGERTVELPLYLYNQNPFDDVEYLINADTYQKALSSWLRRQLVQTLPLDIAYVWEYTYDFSREVVLEGYRRPEVSGTTLPGDAYLEAAAENLDVICAWAEKHPEVEFVVWFPPYSILYWDMMLREGRADAILNAVEYAAQRLMEYDNVAVHCFLHSNYITDLDFYTDHIHCCYRLTRWEADSLMEGKWRLNGENFPACLEGLRERIKSYDFEALLAS